MFSFESTTPHTPHPVSTKVYCTQSRSAVDVSTAITPDSRADIAKIGTLKALTLMLQCYP